MVVAAGGAFEFKMRLTVRFRKLRIAFSATCLIACVLLIVLWVRSYWCTEDISFGG